MTSYLLLDGSVESPGGAEEVLARADEGLRGGVGSATPGHVLGSLLGSSSGGLLGSTRSSLLGGSSLGGALLAAKVEKRKRRLKYVI